MKSDEKSQTIGCWHLTFNNKRRQTPFPNESRRRKGVRKLVKVAGGELVLFCLVDDHLHVIVLCSSRRAGIIARALVRALAPIAIAPLRLGDKRLVKNRPHMTWLVRYLLEQVLHHNIQSAHPALWTGSCFQDLIGARLIGHPLRLWDVLPRLPVSTLCEHVRLSPNRIFPAADTALRAAGVARLADAASAALAAPTDLRGKDPVVMLGKRAVAQLSKVAGIPRAEVAWALGVSVRTANRLLEPPVAPDVLRAIRIRLALEDAARAQPPNGNPKPV